MALQTAPNLTFRAALRRNRRGWHASPQCLRIEISREKGRKKIGEETSEWKSMRATCRPDLRAGACGFRLLGGGARLTSEQYFRISRYMKVSEAIKGLAALAQATRLDTFRLLVKHEPDGVAAGELARSLGVPQNTMSTHLSILSSAGLVEGERHSRTIIYRANIKAFQELTLFMVQDCCGGRPEVCAPLIESLLLCRPPKAKRHARGAV